MTATALTLRCPVCGTDNQDDISVSDPIAVGGSVYQEAHCKWCGEVADIEDFIDIEAADTAPETGICAEILARHYESEANWPPMNATTRTLWRHLTPEARAQTMLAPKQECDESRADGRTEN